MYILFIILTFVSCAFADDIFRKVDDNTVTVTSTVEKSISVKDLIQKRDVLIAKITDLDNGYRAERSSLKSQVDEIDKQLKGSSDAGVDLKIDPKTLKETTVFLTQKPDKGNVP